MKESHRWTILVAVICAAQLGAVPRAIVAQTENSGQLPGKEAAPAEAAEAGSSNPSSAPHVEPPDGKWLVEPDGRRYFIETIPKGVEGRDWVWIGENQIRIYGGLPLEVASHDAETFSVKIYEILPPNTEPPAAVKPSKEELEEVAAQYRPEDLAEGDTLRLDAFDRGLPRTGQWRNGFDVADVNGDGELDIVFGPERKGRNVPHIFLGDGHGSWRAWGADYPDLRYDYGDAKAADFDGDGHLDLALGMHLVGIAVLKGDGEGHFTPFGLQGGDPGSAFSSRALKVTDWNQDGKPDLLALGEGMGGAKSKVASNGIEAYLNHGDGTWERQRISSRYFGDSIEVGDVNGDGRSDLVAANSTLGSGEILYLGTEAGTAEPTPVDKLRPGAWVRTVALSRLDGDDIDDILLGYSNSDRDGIWRTGVDVIYGSRDGNWRRRTLYAEESRATVYALDTGDLNADGHMDVVALTGYGEVWVFLGGDGGRFVKEASPELPKPTPGCFGYGLRLVDIDRDGRDEIVAAFAGELTGMPGITSEPGCPGKGSLRVWTAQPAGEKTGTASVDGGSPSPAAGSEP